jgi:hypothetical protein
MPETLGDACCKILRFILDEHRQDLLPSQRARLIKQLMSMFSMNQKDVAAYLGVNAGSITNWLVVDNYAPEIVKAVDTGEINMHVARSFDGMVPEAQPKIFKMFRREFRTLSGGKLHKLVRSKFPPKSHPEYYIAPEKTAEKLARKSKGRTARKRPRLTRNEKELLSHDLTLKEVELTDGKQELQNLSREIALATQPIRAIMRDVELVAMMPPETRIELERFAEIYV